MENPTVSFILTTYNFAPYIKGAITSLLNQKGDYEFEIIVVDDCSTDNTEEIVAGINDERLKYVRHEENKGVAPTINEAFQLTRGEYVCRFDADDEWYPYLLEKTIPYLENNPSVGFVYGDISMIDSEGNITVEKSNIKDVSGFGQKKLFRAMLDDYFIPAPSIVGRRAAWEDAFPLDNDLIFCDFDLSLEIMKKWKIGYVPYILSKYRVHEGNIHTTSFARKRRGEMSILKSINALFDSTDIFSEEEKKEIIKAKYLSFADSYFGLGSMGDARRCYKKSLNAKDLLNRSDSVRKYLATYMGRGLYDGLKSFYHKFAIAD